MICPLGKIVSLLLLFAQCSKGISVLDPPMWKEPKKIQDGIKLRLLAIGDSTTYGLPSGDGWRDIFRDKLTAGGRNDVDYVGSQLSRTMADGQHEGHQNKTIDEIRKLSDGGITAGPNVVLLHAGSVDMEYNIDPDNAVDRLANLVAYIYKYAPNAVVIVSQIIPSKSSSAANDRIKKFNAKIPGLVSDFLLAGKHIEMVNHFDSFVPMDWTAAGYPNANGYSKMANQWWIALTKVGNKRWIVQPGQ